MPCEEDAFETVRVFSSDPLCSSRKCSRNVVCPRAPAGASEPAGTSGQFCGIIAQYAPAFYATSADGVKFRFIMCVMPVSLHGVGWGCPGAGRCLASAELFIRCMSSVCSLSTFLRTVVPVCVVLRPVCVCVCVCVCLSVCLCALAGPLTTPNARPTPSTFRLATTSTRLLPVPRYVCKWETDMGQDITCIGSDHAVSHRWNSSTAVCACCNGRGQG